MKGTKFVRFVFHEPEGLPKVELERLQEVLIESALAQTQRQQEFAPLLKAIKEATDADEDTEG
jgi:hypothetical protein